MEHDVKQETREHFLILYRWPMIFWSLMMYFLSYYLTLQSSQIGDWQSSLFFTLFFVQALVNFKSTNLIKRSSIGFVAIQMIIVIMAGILISPNETMLYITILPVFGVQIISLFDMKLKTLLWILGPAQIVVILIQLINEGVFLALMALEASIFLNVIFFIAWQFYHRQVNQMIRTQRILQELQVTYTEVKEISQQNERNRIGRELHDTLMQGLAGVTMQLEGIKGLISHGKIQRATAEIEKTIKLSRSSLVDARTAVYEMRREHTDNISFRHRLEKLAELFYENYGLHVNVKITADIQLKSETTETLIRIISEALTNIVKHAETDVALVKIELDKFLIIEIIDFGRGFKVQNDATRNRHFGISSMHERVVELDGTVNISSQVGEGTNIQIKIPCELR